MSELATYAQNHVDLLKRNDYIDPALYEDTESSSDFVRRAAEEF